MLNRTKKEANTMEHRVADKIAEEQELQKPVHIIYKWLL